MGFQLTIAAGLGEGKSFNFEQPETNIGRTSENDVVLYDPGVSRRHARIFEQDGGYLVEDLGSANGTKVNGTLITGAKPLKSGDSVSVGPVVFAFALTELPEPAVAGQETRIVSRAAVLPPEKSAADPELQSMQARQTRALPAVQRPVTGKTPGKVPARAAPAQSAAPARPTRSAPGAGLSAAERARLRRVAGESLGGQLQLMWAELSGRTRVIVGVSAAVLVLGIFGGLGYLFMPDGSGVEDLGPEPDRLGATPIERSFGLGEGVSFRRPDMKVFDFEFNTPTEAVVVLHFRAQDISEGEVLITANGIDQGQVPPDLAGMPDRDIEFVLQSRVLKRNDRNQVIFDNVRNPPGADTWRISHVWIEVVPIPEVSRDEVLASVQTYLTNARELVEQKEVSPENLFKAWKNFRNAWLSLEALEDKPPVYQTARFQMNQLARELDQTCSKLVFDAEVAMRLSNHKKARETLKMVSMYFPTPEHRCHNLAKQKLYEYRL